MGIMDDVTAAMTQWSLPVREARNIALACALEPLSNKAGCVTRFRDDPPNTLEMFVAAGVNVFPAYHDLVEHLLKHKNPEGMYHFFHQVILLSKVQRKGGQINQGILEFSFPIVAAHVLYDPESGQSPEYILERAGDVLKATTEQDLKYFMQGKYAGRDITARDRGKGYVVRSHDVQSVFEYYQKEYELEKIAGKATSVVHNRQFVEGFPDILVGWQRFSQSKGRFSERVVRAYNAIMSKEENLGIGVGLAADFAAVIIYLALTYAGSAEIID